MKDYLQTSQKYHYLMENSREIILFFQNTGQIIDCNKAAKDILGYDDDIFDITIADIFKRVAKIRKNSLVINSNYKNKSSETIAYKKNQTCFPVDLKIIMDNCNGFTGLCIAVDISEKKKLIRIIRYLKSDLKNLNQIKNRFIANITHELKTPVNGIKGMIETLLDMELTPKQKESVNIIYQCCNNMNSLINDLLDITRMKCNKLVLEERRFHFRQMMENIVKLNMKQVNEKNLKFTVNVSRNIPEYLIGDEYRLTQIINNLLSNAIKFTYDGQIILDVAITEHSRHMVELFFMVIDTGIGISTAEMDKLFLSFYQVDGSITRRFGGSGLGLSICQMLVKAMGGKISVESELGKGSTFSFTVKLKLAKVKNKKNIPALSDTIIKEELYQDKNKELVEMLIDETDMTSTTLNEVQNYINKANENKPMLSSGQNTQLLMEKLILSIEMEGWEHAEHLALQIRDLIPKNNKQLTNKALQLLFGIRKEDHDLSLKRAKELESIMSEVNEWRV